MPHPAADISDLRSPSENRAADARLSAAAEADAERDAARGAIEQCIERVKVQAKGNEKRFADTLEALGWALDNLPADADPYEFEE